MIDTSDNKIFLQRSIYIIGALTCVTIFGARESEGHSKNLSRAGQCVSHRLHAIRRPHIAPIIYHGPQEAKILTCTDTREKLLQTHHAGDFMIFFSCSRLVKNFSRSPRIYNQTTCLC